MRNLKNGGKISIWKYRGLNQRPKEWETANMNCYVPLLGLVMSILLSAFTIPFKCNPSTPFGFLVQSKGMGEMNFLGY